MKAVGECLFLDSIAGIFEDERSSPEVRTLAMNIIAKLSLDEDAREDIGIRTCQGSQRHAL